MPSSIVRTLEAYSIHGHVQPGSPEEELLDYDAFFKRIAESDPLDLRVSVGNDTVAISEVSMSSDQIAFRFVSGNADELPLVYDQTSGVAEEVDPGENRFVVNGAWVIAILSARILVLERKRPGVPIYQIERFFGKIAVQRFGYRALAFSLNPVPSPSFAAEVERFTRIREASITLRRPNHSWTRSAESMLGELAESNASEIQLQLNADRGQSLSRTQGVVNEVLRLASSPINALKNAVIKGQNPSYEGERSVSLRKHTVKGTARVNSTDTPRAQLDVMATVASELASQARVSDVPEEIESTNNDPTNLPLDPS